MGRPPPPSQPPRVHPAPSRPALQALDGLESVAGEGGDRASAGLAGGGEYTSSGVPLPRKTFWPEGLVSPPISAPARPLAPCFHRPAL